ncbi:MAG: VCBS repeat-containing protein [Chloroherpetonaceae bacterium]|nr:VCBS repeat-containing protein [Chloroherpetonaceae bacterium]MDW8438119.1 FG-GAP-like repeat-containing protein [Chloroherpetonaceae bacterium]
MRVCLLASLTLLTLTAAPLATRANSALAPCYYRYEIAKTGALSKIVAGDFDGDGFADLAGLSVSERALLTLRAEGRLSFYAPQRASLRNRVRTLLSADLTSQRGADLLMLTAPPERAEVWTATRRGRRLVFKKKAELVLASGAERLYLPPRRANGKRQIFARAQSGRLTTFWFASKGGFSKEEPVPLSHRVAELIVPNAPSSDFFTQALGENALWLNRAAPFSPFPIRCSEPIALAASADFNKNGLLDLVVAQAIPNQKTIVETIFDVGVETGAAPARLETLENPTSLFVEDFNHDGLMDIGLCDGQAFTIHFGQASAKFSESFVIAFADLASSVAVADLNADGRPEIICSERRAGKLVVYSASHYETESAERLATSGEPERIAISASQKQALVSCNKYGRIDRLSFERQPTREASIEITGKIVSLWRCDALRQTFALANSPTTLIRLWRDQTRAQTQSLFSLGASTAAFWRLSEHSATLVALLETQSTGAVPQLLFYAVGDDSLLSASELMLERPINAEDIVAIASATLKQKPLLVALKSDKKSQAALVVYELKAEKTRLRLAEEARYALPRWFAAQDGKRLCVRINKNETADFLVASDKAALLLLAERLHQPKPIFNFPKIGASDLIAWRDIDGDERDDLLVSRHQRAELLWLRGRAKDEFDAPKIVLNDVVAKDVALASLKHRSTLFVSNAKLHTLDILRVKK